MRAPIVWRSSQILTMSKSILVVAAHPDDEVLGCGASIAKHARAGDSVHVLILADGETSRIGVGPERVPSREDQCRGACDILGVTSVTFSRLPDNRMDTVDRLEIIRLIETAIAVRAPDTIYTHYTFDLNNDHAIVSHSVTVACRPKPAQTVKQLLFFEIPSSTEWRPPSAVSFAPNWFNDVSTTLDAKCTAMQCYTSELLEFPHPRSLQGIRSLAQWHGAGSGCAAAEAFVLARSIE